jgi:hypothetical protein
MFDIWYFRRFMNAWKVIAALLSKKRLLVKMKQYRFSGILTDRHSYVPTGILATHIFAVGYLSVVVVRTIYRSYIALPPSSATRYREPLRQGYVQAFSLLALASLAAATFFGVSFSSLSYRVWATERGVELPTRFGIPTERFPGGGLTYLPASSGIMEPFEVANILGDFRSSGGLMTPLCIGTLWR